MSVRSALVASASVDLIFGDVVVLEGEHRLWHFCHADRSAPVVSPSVSMGSRDALLLEGE